MRTRPRQGFCVDCQQELTWPRTGRCILRNLREDARSLVADPGDVGAEHHRGEPIALGLRRHEEQQEPDELRQLLVVITAYPVDQSKS